MKFLPPVYSVICWEHKTIHSWGRIAFSWQGAAGGEVEILQESLMILPIPSFCEEMGQISGLSCGWSEMLWLRWRWVHTQEIVFCSTDVCWCSLDLEHPPRSVCIIVTVCSPWSYSSHGPSKRWGLIEDFRSSWCAFKRDRGITHHPLTLSGCCDVNSIVLSCAPAGRDHVSLGPT